MLFVHFINFRNLTDLIKANTDMQRKVLNIVSMIICVLQLLEFSVGPYIYKVAGSISKVYLDNGLSEIVHIIYFTYVFNTNNLDS